MINNTTMTLTVPTTIETILVTVEHENRSHMTPLSELSSTQDQSLAYVLVPIILVLSVALFSGLVSSS